MWQLSLESAEATMLAAITPPPSPQYYLLQAGKWKTGKRSKQRKISHIVKALNETWHQLVRDNMLHNVLLHSIINILLVDSERA